MTRFVPAAMALGLLLAAHPVAAGCRWFGTQLECRLGDTDMLIGTQAEDEPTRAWPSQPFGFHAGDRLFQNRPIPERRFQIELQNVGADPDSCRKIGNETYCY